MTDDPRELRQAAEWIMATAPSGRILVAGLGLGIVPTWLSRVSGTVQVTVVEKQTEVISMVATQQKGYSIIQADIFDYVRDLDEWCFDYAFLDIWMGTNEFTWWDTVMPLRRMIANKFGRQQVFCWAEDIMHGQIVRAILFGNRSWHYTGLPKLMSEHDARTFVAEVGLPEWEERWGTNVRR